ncbi:MAG: methyltransferase domain-containing protein [Myxococcota bacterium]
MDRRTVQVYERQATEWMTTRHPRSLEDGRLDAFARGVAVGGRVADLGCGPGWYAEALSDRGLHPVALDATQAMLSHARPRTAACVQADLAALPFARATLDGIWASSCYMHLPLAELPQALADAHRCLRPGAPLGATLVRLQAISDPPARRSERCSGEAQRRDSRPPFDRRLFTCHSPERARELLHAAGFEAIDVQAGRSFWMWVMARAARTLPDSLRPGLRLLICGLNPSLYSVDRGIPFARPGNRFWPAAREAGLVDRERDLRRALAAGIGFTDCVKRATSRADEVRPAEWGAGLARVEGLVRRYRPGALCFVGLAGWRRAVDRSARPGWVEGGFAGRPAYLMPSTSGLNAHSSLSALAEHLRSAARGR